MTDGMRLILGSSGPRYADLFAPVETRTSEEVIGGVMEKLKNIREGDG